MSISRYGFSQKIEVNGKVGIGRTQANDVIRRLCERGLLRYTTRILQEGERLDQISGEVYGDSSYWWVIASASGVGWSLQIAPGALLRIPVSIEEVLGALV